MTPVLHLTVGLPAVGKTTLAKELADTTKAVRLTPDEWMLPLFGESDANGMRDVLEGRFIWLAREIVTSGSSVILDFGCWTPEERYAIRDIAERSGAGFALHVLEIPESERRGRALRRWQETPGETFPMSDDDHDQYVASYVPPSPVEIAGGPMSAPPAPYPTWPAWASYRWPGLPRLDR